jgi:mono/diheme cytochrome c family protein
MKIILFLAALICLGTAHADESLLNLKEDNGRHVVEANCVMCHSLDYIQMNSPFLDRTGWEASVGKMMKVMGAPIATEDVKVIVDYLLSQYGKQ